MGRIYVSGGNQSNALRLDNGGLICPAGPAPVVLIDSSGDGINALDTTSQIALDPAGNVFVVGEESDNVFRIATNGTITQILDASGDGTNALDAPSWVATDAFGNVYVTGRLSGNAFKIQFCGDGMPDPGEACDDGNSG